MQQTLKDLERLQQLFRRADFPRFKKKGQSDSFRYDFRPMQPPFPELGWLRSTRRSSRWTCHKGGAVGIDLGVMALPRYRMALGDPAIKRHEARAQMRWKTLSGNTETHSFSRSPKPNAALRHVTQPAFSRNAWPLAGTDVPCLGHVQARFLCVECGFEENADLVGAINILSRGMQRLTKGAPPTPPGLTPAG